MNEIIEEDLPVFKNGKGITEEGLPILKKKEISGSISQDLSIKSPESGSEALSISTEPKYQYQWSDSQPLRTASIAPHPAKVTTKIGTVSQNTSVAALAHPELYNKKENREQYISTLDLPKEEQKQALEKFDSHALAVEDIKKQNELIKKDPNNPEPQLKVIDNFISLGSIEQADKLADQVIAAHPTWSPAYSYKAKIQADNGNYAFGVGILDKGIEQNPADPTLYNNRASIKSQSGDYQGAIQDIDTGLKFAKNPNLLENMWVQKAIIFKKLLDASEKPDAEKLIEQIYGKHNPHIDQTNKEFFLEKYQEAFNEANKYASQNKEVVSTEKESEAPNTSPSSAMTPMSELQAAQGLHEQRVASGATKSGLNNDQEKIKAQAELTNKIINPDKPLTNYVLEYVKEHGEQVVEGVKQAGTGLKEGGVKGALDLLLGSANAVFGVASLAVPEMAAFNVAASAAPDKLNEWAFSSATSVADAMGYKPTEGSIGKKALKTVDLLLPLLVLHKAGKSEVEVKKIETVEEKLKNGQELSKEDAPIITETLKTEATTDNLKKALEASGKVEPVKPSEAQGEIKVEPKAAETSSAVASEPKVVATTETDVPKVEGEVISPMENKVSPEVKEIANPEANPQTEGITNAITDNGKNKEGQKETSEEITGKNGGEGKVTPTLSEGTIEEKKSLINRVYEGKTPEEIKTSVEKHGLNYTIESHPQAERKSSDFVKEVGIDNALEAVRDNKVEGGAAPFVWATAIDAVHKEYLAEKNPKVKLKLAEKEASLIDEFDKKSRSSGRFSSALQAVYQVSDLGYKRGTILNRAKEANLGESVPEILKERLADLSSKLEEVNQKMAEKEKTIEYDADTRIAKEVDKLVKTIHDKLPTERRRKADKAIAALEGMQERLRANAYSSVIPIPIIDAGISVIKSAIKAGVNIADAVELGINHIKERYGKNWERENDFRKDVLDEFKKQNLDFKKEPRNSSDLEKYKETIKKSIEKQRKKLTDKDFSKKTKPSEPVLDKEAFNLLVEKNKLKDEIDTEIEKLRLKNRPMIDKVEDNFVDAINLPKSLLASADLSAPLRQGAVLGYRHPIMASEAMVEMLKQAFSEKKAIDWLTRLRSSPEYKVMQDAGLYISEPTAKLAAKEEQFISNIAHKIPIWGHVVKGSERAYTGYLNKLRVDVFAQFHDGLIKQGIKGEEFYRELESFADFVNNASGRGNLGRFEDSAAGLNATIFSPRYAISRFNLINPYEYYKMAPKARAEALKTLGVYIGMGSTVLALAQAGGAKVVLDPRSSDFGKIRIGDTRFDIWSGFQQWVRLAAQIASGEKTTLQGKTVELGRGYKSDTRLDLIGRFLRFKASPALGFSMDVLSGKDAGGKDVSYKFKNLDSFLNTEEGKLIVPLYLQDLHDAAQSNNKGVVAAGALGAFFGAGVSTYPDKK